MANREVNLTKRVQNPHGRRYCRVLLSANGRVQPDTVVVNGKVERHAEGAYYLEWREGVASSTQNFNSGIRYQGKPSLNAGHRMQPNTQGLRRLHNWLFNRIR
jgi:hypothetical protein